jgi:small subunit ribosomal protein S17
MEQHNQTPTTESQSKPVLSRVEGRRVKQGRVASNKMDKTIVVVTETRVPHGVYGKIVRKSSRFKAHDENNEAQIGDMVRIMECRPLSRDKRWRLVEIVERAK